jgi:hypothetical protein
MAEQSDSLLDILGYIFFCVFDVPYIADTEVLGVILPESTAESIPGVNKIDRSKLTLKHYIFLVIPFLFDREYFKLAEKIPLIGRAIPDPFEDALSDVGGTDFGNQENYNSREQNRAKMSRDDREYRDLRRTDDSDGISLPWKTAGKLVGGGAALLVLLIVGVGTVSGGSGYGMLASDMLGGYTDGFSGFADSVGYQVNQAVKTITCFGNAGCIREWRLNNTQRPGSEDVGETYRLRVSGPEITGGNDVRYQPADATIPVDFRVKNTRHGLKGINATNVRYRVKIRDPSLLDSGEAFCRTDWQPLNKYGSGSDVDETIAERNNLLLPGQSASPLNYGDNEEARLTLKECGLMNPVDTNVEAVVQVKYDYSAMAFLNLETMASRNFQGSVSEKISKTPNTPVETSIHAPDPVLFDEVGGERIPRPFQAQVQISTDEDNVDFRIDAENFTLTDSSITTDSGSCNGLNHKDGNTYNFSTEIGERIERRQENEDWFSSRVSTPQATCTFTLENPSEVSATGETITMTATANYTLRQNTKSEGFNMRNTLCSTENCPMLVPIQSKDIDNGLISINLDEDSPYSFEEASNWDHEDYWEKEYAYCNRPFDAQSGCSVIRSFSLEDRQNPLEEPTIRSGDLALNITNNIPYKMVTRYVELRLKSGNIDPQTISIKPNQLENAFKFENRALNYTGTGNDREWVIIDDYEPGSYNSHSSDSTESSNSESNDSKESSSSDEDQKKCGDYDSREACNENGCLWYSDGPGACSPK